MERTPIALVPGETYERIGIFSWGKGMLRRDPASVAEMGSMKYFSFPIPSLIFSNIQAWEGAVALASVDDVNFVCSSRFYPYVPREGADVNLGYLLEFFRSEDGLALMRRASPGTQVRNKVLSRAALEASRIPLPPRSDQDRIAAHLRRLHGSPVGLENIARLVELIVERAAGAEEVTLGSVLELQRRSVEIDVESTYQEIGVRSFGKGLFIKEPVTGSALGGKRVFRIEPGDFIVSNVFGWEGAVGVAGPAHRGLVGSHRFMTWTPPGDLNVDYLLAYFRTRAGVARLAAASPGSAGRNRTLSVASFRSIKVPVPTPEQQDWIAAQIHAVDQIDATSRGAAALTAAILPAARNEIFSALR